MPDHAAPDRTPAQRKADHAHLARLSETLVPALVAKLAASGLAELEVREGDWRIRLRRPVSDAPTTGARRPDRPRLGTHAERDGRVGRDARASTPAPQVSAGAPADPGPAPAQRLRGTAMSPAVGVFHPGVAVGSRVRAGDRIATVDLLGIAQDVVAPIDGTLVDVLPQDGDPVEYGEEVATIEHEPEPLPGHPGEGSPDAEDAADGEPAPADESRSGAPDPEDRP